MKQKLEGFVNQPEVFMGVASISRRVLLVVLIALDIAMLLFWWLGGQYVFFWVFVGINICVIAGEVISAIFSPDHQTLSTKVTKTLEAGGEKAAWVYLALTTFTLSMIALVFHLLITGK